MTDNPSPTDEPQAAPATDAGPALTGGAIAPEVSRRVSSILDAVEREAGRLREDAIEEARRYLDYSRRRADSLVAERQRRVAELSDEIIEKAEAVVGRLDDAAPVREGFENLVRALGDAAERLSREVEETRDDFNPPSFHDDALNQPEPTPPSAPVAPSPSPPPEPVYEPDPPAQPAYQADPPPPPQPTAPQSEAPQPHPARAPAPEPPPAPVPAARQAGAGDWEGIGGAKLVAIQMAAAGRTRQQVRDHLHNALGVTDTRSTLDEIFGAGSAEDARVPWTAFPR